MSEIDRRGFIGRIAAFLGLGAVAKPSLGYTFTFLGGPECFAGNASLGKPIQTVVTFWTREEMTLVGYGPVTAQTSVPLPPQTGPSAEASPPSRPPSSKSS
jgi:hypothetical protein